jgi:hypothetical protein
MFSRENFVVVKIFKIVKFFEFFTKQYSLCYKLVTIFAFFWKPLGNSQHWLILQK